MAHDMLNADSFIKSVQESIHLAVHPRNYKNGAFKQRITETTTVRESLEIFLASTCLNEKERATFQDVHHRVVDYEQGCWSDLPLGSLVQKTTEFSKLFELFEDDMRSQGQYVAPTMFQVVDDAGHVKETHTIDSKGNTAGFQGGKPGVVPGAPTKFNKENSKHAEKLCKPRKSTNTSERNVGENSTGAANKDARKKDNSKNKNFGKDFEANIRDAFL